MFEPHVLKSGCGTVVMFQEILLRWWSAMIENIREVASNDRNLYYESIVRVMERPELAVLKTEATKNAYFDCLLKTLSFVVVKLDFKSHSMTLEVFKFCCKVMGKRMI